jgi:tetratricopeptide (TPR) repeat protein
MLVAGVLIFSVQFVSAQSLEEARELYNSGGQATTDGDLETAIQNFEDCISICETLVEEEEDMDAEDLLLTVQQNMPKLYWQLCQTKVKDKDYAAGLKYAKKAKSAAGEMNDEDIVSKASQLASKLYYSFSLSKYKSKNYDEALTQLDNSVNEYPENFKAHLLKVVILKETGNEDALIAATKEIMAIQKEDNNKDKAVSITANYFYNEGVKAKQASDYDKALNNIDTSLEFNGENADAYYLKAAIYNAKQDWDNAVASVNTGLQYEEASADAKARFYYELGNAYAGKGDNAGACEAYGKAATGVYTENANYQINEVLKCN